MKEISSTTNSAVWSNHCTSNVSVSIWSVIMYVLAVRRPKNTQIVLLFLFYIAYLICGNTMCMQTCNATFPRISWFPLFILSDLQFKSEKLQLKTHKFVQEWYSFFLYSLVNFDDKVIQVCYVMHMLGRTKWKYWSLTITKGVQCI